MSFKFVKICLLLVLVGYSSSSAQESDEQIAEETKAVVSQMAAHHLLKPKIDEQFCKRWFDEYLESLDPYKLYFLAVDMNEFKSHLHQLPEYAKTGDPVLFRLVSKRYQERATSALTHAIDRIEKDFDFEKDEELILENDNWSKTESERIDRWRRKLKYEVLVEQTHANNTKDDIQFLKVRYESILAEIKSDSTQEQLKAYLDSFCRSLDPHSGYLTKREMLGFRGSMFKRYTIGLRLVFKKGRAMIRHVEKGHAVGESKTAELLGCELLAIKTAKGEIHNLRNNNPFKLADLIRHGLKTDARLTLELFDEVRQIRFAVKWRLKEV